MQYTTDKQELYTLMTLQEDKLSSVIAPDLKTAFVTLELEGCQNLIIDLTDVKFADSSGLSGLLSGNRIFKEVGGWFILTGLSPYVSKLLAITQLNRVLNIADNVEEGVKAIQDAIKDKEQGETEQQ